MGRSLLIVGLVGLLLATGVAGASTAGEVRLPVTLTHEADPATASEDEVVVEKGDHLWKISASHLESHAPGQRIAPYWLEVIEQNTPRLRSGDPDLIYPGELIQMPGISEQP